MLPNIIYLNAALCDFVSLTAITRAAWATVKTSIKQRS